MRLFRVTSLVIGNPFPLKQNEGKSFQGSIVLGKGFVLTPQEAESLISKDSRNKDVLFPYLNGEDLNNDPEQKASRWVINFFDWSEEKARSYPDCFEIIERLVKPERQRWKIDENGQEVEGTYALRKPLPQKWWIYGEKRPALYETISKLDQVMVLNRYSKHLAFDFQSNRAVFSDSIIVFALDTYYDFSIMTSSIHEIWAWKNSSTMGASTLRYSPTNAFDTFVFPNTHSINAEKIGFTLSKHRKRIMQTVRIGLTELYNLFHNDNIQNSSPELSSLILRLRSMHIDLDKVIMDAFNWNDINLAHGFYQVEYLPENDRTRFTIHPDARKEILKRLTILNQEKHHIENAQHQRLKKTKKRGASEATGLFQVNESEQRT